VVGAWPSAAAAQTLPNWSSVAPALSSGGYDPSSSNICVAGRPGCVDVVIKEMNRRFQPLARRCDHNAIFSLAYLRTTEVFKSVFLRPGYFQDPPFLAHEAAVFADWYFDAYDAWAGGRRARVPPAWLVAFDGAKAREQPANSDLSLGISAHVNNDLPQVLAQIGLVKPDGSSRKRDHDKVNDFLELVTEPLYDEIDRRFDPEADDGDVPGYLDEDALFNLIITWRERAWRNAEDLARAGSSSTRAAVVRRIETEAGTTSSGLATASAYRDGGVRLATRTAHCREHWDDA
jgi:hypothetical protein